MRTGIDENTGQLLRGWPHCVQTMRKIFRARINGQVHPGRHLGSGVPDIQDGNATPNTLMELYIKIAEALEDPQDGELGFVLETIEMIEGQADNRAGKFQFEFNGIFFPFGHIGDFSIQERAQFLVPIKDITG